MQNYSEFSQHKFMIDTATGPPPLYSVNISIGGGTVRTSASVPEPRVSVCTVIGDWSSAAGLASDWLRVRRLD